MNYLDLVRSGMLLTRTGEKRLSEPMTSFSGATGPEYEMIQWIAQADVDIQNYRSGWLFMRNSGDIVLNQGETQLVPAAAQNTIRAIVPAEDSAGRRSLGCYRDSLADESRVLFVDYETWYGSRIGAGVVRDGRPMRCTERAGRLLFDSAADANYHITFDFIRKSQKMTTETSESLVPEEHRMAIVWWALLHYYCLTRDKAQELRAKSEVELHRELTRMFNAQLPPTSTGF